MRAHVFGQGTVNGGGIRAKAALEGLLAGVFAQMASERALLATGVRTKLTLEGLFPRVDADVLRQIAFCRRRVRAKRTLERLLLSILSSFDFGPLLLRGRSGKVKLWNEGFLLDEILGVSLFLFVPACRSSSAACAASRRRHVHRGHVTSAYLFLHLPLVRRQLLLRMMLLRRRLMLLRRLMLRRRGLMLLLLNQMRLQMVMRIVHHFGGGSGKMRWRGRIMSYIHLRKTKDGNLMHQKRWRIQGRRRGVGGRY